MDVFWFGRVFYLLIWELLFVYPLKNLPFECFHEYSIAVCGFFFVVIFGYTNLDKSVELNGRWGSDQYFQTFIAFIWGSYLILYFNDCNKTERINIVMILWNFFPDNTITMSWAFSSIINFIRTDFVEFKINCYCWKTDFKHRLTKSNRIDFIQKQKMGH